MSEPISRDEVLAVVKKHMTQIIDGLNADEIDPARSVVDFGANSLDIVDIISSAMRELKVKAPRADLAGLHNINELVDFLHRIAVEKAQADPPA
jgi:polyketide biosynthesis acyl carrier protein